MLEATLHLHLNSDYISKTPEMQHHHKLHQASWCSGPSPSQSVLHWSCSFCFPFPIPLLGFQSVTSPMLGFQTTRDFPRAEGRERHLWPQHGGVLVGCINQGRGEQANSHQDCCHSEHILDGEGNACEHPQLKRCCTIRQLDPCVGRRGETNVTRKGNPKG